MKIKYPAKIPKQTYQSAKRDLLNLLEKHIDKYSMMAQFTVKTLWAQSILIRHDIYGGLGTFFLEKLVEEKSLAKTRDGQYFYPKARKAILDKINEERKATGFAFDKINALLIPPIPLTFICLNCDTKVIGYIGDILQCPECGIGFIGKDPE